MAKKTWSLNLDGLIHKVELDHKYISGKRQIWVDGNELELGQKQAKQFFDFGSNHQFQIGNHLCSINIYTNGITFSYDLIIDGVSMNTGKQCVNKTGGFDSKTKQKLSMWWLWSRIEDEETAETILKNVFVDFIIIIGIGAVASSFLGNFYYWIDFVIFSLISFLIWKKKSITASILLIILCILEPISAIAYKFTSENNIGPNLGLSLLLIYASIRAYQAVSWFNKNKIEEIPLNSSQGSSITT